MRTLFRVLFVAYVLFLVACAVLVATDPTEGPYRHLARAIGAVAAGLPWTLVGFVVYPREAGPVPLYGVAVVGALVNVAVLARLAEWWPRGNGR